MNCEFLRPLKVYIKCKFRDRNIQKVHADPGNKRRWERALEKGFVRFTRKRELPFRDILSKKFRLLFRFRKKKTVTSSLSCSLSEYCLKFIFPAIGCETLFTVEPFFASIIDYLRGFDVVNNQVPFKKFNGYTDMDIQAVSLAFLPIFEADIKGEPYLFIMVNKRRIT